MLMGAWGHTFEGHGATSSFLVFVPTTEGECALSEAVLVFPGEDHRVSAGIHGFRLPMLLPGYR